jgi:4-aminobutyrate aminotransferase-like enzyme
MAAPEPRPIQRTLNRRTKRRSSPRIIRTRFSTRALGDAPTGASTGSKRSQALYGHPDAVGLTHFTQAVGCRVTDVDGNEYLDCTMALGAVALDMRRRMSREPSSTPSRAGTFRRSRV